MASTARAAGPRRRSTPPRRARFTGSARTPTAGAGTAIGSPSSPARSSRTPRSRSGSGSRSWRAAMRGDAFPLTGEVEVDETYVGGKAVNAHRGNRGRKTSATPGKRGNLVPPKVGVVGAIARKGNVVCKVIGSMEAPTIKEFVHEAVSKDVSLIASDDHPA
ncbi:MAG: transposase [Deltaproteobacteria bacterium]|nr:MAG: transposase [Deltaproteobacteria bacterium]